MNKKQKLPPKINKIKKSSPITGTDKITQDVDFLFMFIEELLQRQIDGVLKAK